MSNDIGRNDPCFCGSGRKYKNCHLKPLLPKDFFQVEMKAFEIVKMVEYRLPPTIIAGPPTIYAHDPYPWGDEIIQILKLLNEIKWNENDKWQRHAKGRVQKLYHKLNALKFHSIVFINEERKKEQDFRNFTIGSNQYSLVIENPILIYITEAFLFQAKSCLDVLAQLIGFNFKINVTTYKNFGVDLLNKLNKNPLKYHQKECDELKILLKKNKDWIKKLIEMRDEVTHYSDLEGLSCFLQTICDSKFDTYVKIYYPSLTDGTRITNYMNYTFTNLTKLINEYSKIAVSLVNNSQNN